MKLPSFSDQQPSGYVALLTVSVVMGAVIIVGITITLLVATGLLTTFTVDRGTLSYYLADSCAYEALYRAKTEGSGYVGSHSLTIDGHECTIDVTAGPGTALTIEVEGNYDDTAYRTIYIEVETSTFGVNSWQETQ